MKVLSLAVALLLDSSSAIQLHKSEKNLIDIKSEMRDNINLNIQSKIDALENQYAQIQFNEHQIQQMLVEKDNENAVKNLKEMRNDLVNIADDIQLAAQDAKKHPEQLKEISKYVSNISGKVGVVQDLEKRLDIMQGLDPLMGGILEKMNQVTDHSEIMRLQQENSSDNIDISKLSIAQKEKKQKKEAEDQALDDSQSLSAQILGKSQPSVTTAEEKSDSNDFVVAAGALSGTKEDRIAQIMQNTMKQIDENDKYNDWDKDDAKSAALRNIHDAIATGSHVKDIKNTMPDFTVEEHTHVDHDHPWLPPHLSKQTTVTDVRPNTVDAVGPTMVSNSHSSGRPGAPHVPHPAPRVLPTPIMAAHAPVMAGVAGPGYPVAGYPVQGYPVPGQFAAPLPGQFAAAMPAGYPVHQVAPAMPAGYTGYPAAPAGFVAQSPYGAVAHGASITTIQHAPGVGGIAASYGPGVVQAHSVAESQSGFQGGAPEAGDEETQQAEPVSSTSKQQQAPPTAQAAPVAPQEPQQQQQSQPQPGVMVQASKGKSLSSKAKQIKDRKEIRGAEKLLSAVKDFNNQNDIDESGMKKDAQSIFSSLAEHDSYLKHNGTHADLSSEDPDAGTDEIVTDVQM